MILINKGAFVFKEQQKDVLSVAPASIYAAEGGAIILRGFFYDHLITP